MHRLSGDRERKGLRRLSILSVNRSNRSKLPTCSPLGSRPGGVSDGNSLLPSLPARRQLRDRITHQLQTHSPILAGADTVVAIAAHIQGAVKAFLDAALLPEETPAHEHLRRRRSLRRTPQQLNQLSGKLFVSRQR